MGALSRLSGPPVAERRSFSIEDFTAMLVQGLGQFGLRQTLMGKEERSLDGSLQGFVEWAMKRDGVVFAAIALRAAIFSEARFLFRRFQNGQPGDLFGSSALALLEHPAPGEVTGDLLAKASIYADLSGEAWIIKNDEGDGLSVFPADWITVAVASRAQPEEPLLAYDTRVIGYGFHPGGFGVSPAPTKTWLAGPVDDPDNRVAHFKPIPDPATRFRGMPWLLPVINEIKADRAMTEHKLAYFINGAAPAAVVTLDSPLIKDEKSFRAWIQLFNEEHKGAANAYKNLFLLGGTKYEQVGTTLSQNDFSTVQGAGELRIASAARIPPVLLGLGDALQGSSLNQGNFSAARRYYADFTMRPHWRNISGSLETIVDVPAGASLWYDDRDIPALAEDQKDAADTLFVLSQAMRQLADGGWKPDSVRDSVTSGDLKRLEHTGMLPVQQFVPGANPPPANAAADQPPTVRVSKPETPQLPAGRSMPLLGSGEVRCPKCNRKIMEMATPPYAFTCTNTACKAEVRSAEGWDDELTVLVSEPARAAMVAADERMDRLIAAMGERSIRVDSPVTIAEGAFRIEPPAIAPPRRLRIVRTEDGAVVEEIA